MLRVQILVPLALGLNVTWKVVLALAEIEAEEIAVTEKSEDSFPPTVMYGELPVKCNVSDPVFEIVNRKGFLPGVLDRRHGQSPSMARASIQVDNLTLPPSDLDDPASVLLLDVIRRKISPEPVRRDGRSPQDRGFRDPVIPIHDRSVPSKDDRD